MKNWLLIAGIVIIGCTSGNQKTNKQLANDELQIHKLHSEYVEGWVNMEINVDRYSCYLKMN